MGNPDDRSSLVAGGTSAHHRVQWLAVFFALAILVGIDVPASASSQPETAYAALGDSYSAGTGAGDYGDSGDCKRSANAYPARWSKTHAVSRFDFVACLGARTTDVLGDQLTALGAETTLVTLSVGGNDAGFTDVLTDCTVGTDQACRDRINTAKNYVRHELPAKLDTVYAGVARAAPNARIVVLGYPRIYQLGGSCDAGLSEVKRTAINSAANVLAEVTAERVAAAGLTFSDVRGRFDGHEICSPDWWLRSLGWPVDESYHPTATGQAKGYLPALTSIVG